MTCFCRLLCVLLLGVGWPLAFAQPRSPAVVQTVPGVGRAAVPLHGEWAFHLGDDPRWASPNMADADWERISAEKPWGRQGHFAYQGFAWYRLHFQVPSVDGADPDLALMVPYAADAYEVYWNGQRVGGTGRLPPHAAWPAYPRPGVFQLGKGRAGVLAVRMWRAPLTSYDDGLGGGFATAPVLGSPEAIRLLNLSWSHATLRDNQFAIGVSLVYAMVGLASLFGWLRRRRGGPLLLWLGLFALGSVLQSRWLHVMLHWTFRQEALGAVVYQPMMDISTWYLLLYLLDLRGNARLMRWARWLAWTEIGLLVVDGVAITFWANGWPQALDLVMSELILIPELFPVALIAFALGKRLPLASWFVAGFALLADVLLAFGAFLSQGERFTHWTVWEKLLIPLFTVNGNGFSAQSIAATLLLVSLIAAVYQVLVREAERRESIDREFQSAQELQRVLIPEDLPSVHGYEVTSAYRPALEVGGDFFQLLPQGGGSALVVVGDVSGKGLAAAMAVSLIIGTIRTLAEQLPGPAEMLAGINRRLVGKLHGGFATCVVVQLKPDGTLCVASAGHPGPFLNGHELALQGALPLGISLDLLFEERTASLHVGDHLTLFSDGLIEARRPDNGALFGFDRVQAMAAGCAKANDFADAAVAFGQEDDITVVTVTRLRVGAESRTSLTAPQLVDRPAQAR